MLGGVGQTMTFCGLSYFRNSWQTTKTIVCPLGNYKPPLQRRPMRQMRGPPMFGFGVRATK